MPDKKQINDDKLEKVYGGTDIVNADTRTQEELEKDDLERQIKALQEILNSGGKSYQETMELMNKITKLMRELNGDDGTSTIKKAE